jgi:structural maintenance of chromosome 3 (chondroitin sulfate proteoglycan 6)
MSETDAKRTKIKELLEYIESRLAELEEEKEELKEFQAKDKERRCLEYALYQRELEEVGKALEEIEEERRGEVHGANVRREQYNDRETDIQVRPEVCLVTLRLISVNSALKTSSLPPNTLYRPWASLAKVLNPNSTT